MFKLLHPHTHTHMGVHLQYLSVCGTLLFRCKQDMFSVPHTVSGLFEGEVFGSASVMRFVCASPRKDVQTSVCVCVCNQSASSVEASALCSVPFTNFCLPPPFLTHRPPLSTEQKLRPKNNFSTAGKNGKLLYLGAARRPRSDGSETSYIILWSLFMAVK